MFEKIILEKLQKAFDEGRDETLFECVKYTFPKDPALMDSHYSWGKMYRLLYSHERGVVIWGEEAYFEAHNGLHLNKFTEQQTMFTVISYENFITCGFLTVENGFPTVKSEVYDNVIKEIHECIASNVDKNLIGNAPIWLMELVRQSFLNGKKQMLLVCKDTDEEETTSVTICKDPDDEIYVKLTDNTGENTRIDRTSDIGFSELRSVSRDIAGFMKKNPRIIPALQRAATSCENSKKKKS